MRPGFVLPLLLLISAIAGCPPSQTRVIDDLPDPIVHTKHWTPPQHPAKPRPPVTGTPKAPAGWTPRGGISKRWKTIVIHHSATRAGGATHFDAMHRGKGWDELGYHFVIGNGTDTSDGVIEVGSRWKKQKHGAHCKVPGNYYNDHGIGICLVGNFESATPSAKQMASLARLVAFLCNRANISLHRVTTHRRVTGKTLCPGRNFSLAALKRAAQGRRTKVAASR